LNTPTNHCHRSLPANGIHRILVCRPNHRLGNTILLTPLIDEIEKIYKGAEIDLITEGDIAKEVFPHFLAIKNIYCLRRRGFKHPIAFLSTIARVRATHYDLIIDPCVGSNFSRILTRFFKARYKLGFSDLKKHRGLTHSVPGSMAPRHMAERPIHLLHQHIPNGKHKSLHPMPLDIRLTDIERAQGKSLTREILSESHRSGPGPVIGIFANATGSKCYPKEWWKDFIASFKEAIPNCVIIEIVPMHGRSMLDSEWPSYYSTGIRRMSAVMASTDLMISADCGVMHLAAASGTPTIGLFSVTDAAVYAPYGPGNHPLLTQGLSAQESARSVVETYSKRLGVRADAHAALMAHRTGLDT
jgi:ADP-heptose:LPS heptosyltransferase